MVYYFSVSKYKNMKTNDFQKLVEKLKIRILLTHYSIVD